MSRESFIFEHPLEQEFEKRGIPLKGGGNTRMALCPFHADKNPSLSVDIAKQLWNCHAGCGGGSVLDFISRMDGVSVSELLKTTQDTRPVFRPSKTVKTQPEPSGSEIKPSIEKTYSYKNAVGQEVYQAVRLIPKSFRQRHPDGKGGWKWSMDDVERVLYRLPEILKSQQVAICEGEKDAETLASLGYCGTCNVGGAGKWMDAYTESVAGKDVLIFGDNDEPGRKHAAMVFESVAGKALSVKVIKIPDTYKDITEYVESFVSLDEAKKVIDGMVQEAHPFLKGIEMPLRSMAEIEPMYKRHVENSENESLDLGRWIPSLGRNRRLVPGEMVLLMGDTGVGKTALLSNIALACKPLPTVMIEMELPGELLYERFVAASQSIPCKDVEGTYRNGYDVGEKALNHHFPHLFICWESKQTAETIERLINRAELKIGKRPKVVLLDYVQLIKGAGGNRRERVATIAEDLKVIAKTTRTIVIIASQVSRPFDDDPEIHLHDAKEAGELENSSGLVLGAWRDPKNREILHLKILKNTKGYSGQEILCNFNGETMKITEMQTP